MTEIEPKWLIYPRLLSVPFPILRLSRLSWLDQIYPTGGKNEKLPFHGPTLALCCAILTEAMVVFSVTFRADATMKISH